MFRAIAEDLSHLGGSSFLTEFGGCDTAEEVPTCIHIMNDADKTLQSWSAYDSFAQTGNEAGRAEAWKGMPARRPLGCGW